MESQLHQWHDQNETFDQPLLPDLWKGQAVLFQAEIQFFNYEASEITVFLLGTQTSAAVPLLTTGEGVVTVLHSIETEYAKTIVNTAQDFKRNIVTLNLFRDPVMSYCKCKLYRHAHQISPYIYTPKFLK